MKTSGKLQKVNIQNWQGKDKISYQLNGAWYGVYFDKLEPDMVDYVKSFHEGDEVEIEYEVKNKLDGTGTYTAMLGIVPVTRPEGSPAPPVQPAGQLLKPKAPWQGGGKRVEEDPDKKIRSMTVSYSHDFEIARNEGQPTPWRVDYDEVIRGARILEKYIKEG